MAGAATVMAEAMVTGRTDGAVARRSAGAGAVVLRDLGCRDAARTERPHQLAASPPLKLSHK